MPLEGTTDFFLKQGTALRLLYQRAEPLLFITKFLRPINEPTDAFVYRYDNVGMDADPKKKKPAHAMIGGDFPEIDLSRSTYAAGMVDARGFQIRIKRKTIRNEPKGVSEIQRAYKTAGYWMARFIHDDALAAIKAGATTPTWTPTSVWSAAGATPFDDLRKFKNTMKREGYEYKMTDVLLHNDNYEELEGYLATVDITDMQRMKIYGVPTVNRQTINIPLVGDITGVLSGMTEGSILGLDRDNPCAELHYYVDPKFGTDKVSYETIQNGVKSMVEADNIGFQFYTYEEQNTNDQILRFSVESKTVVTEAYAAQYDTGI